MLLAGAGLMIRSFMTLYSVDIGIALDGLMTMRMQLPESKYARPEARRAFFERLEPRLAAIPGVEAAAMTDRRAAARRWRATARDRRAAAHPPEPTPVFVSTVTISPRFFDVVGVPLAPRDGLSRRDGAPGAETVIINERLAAQFFPERIRSEGGSASRNETAAPDSPPTSGARSSASARRSCTARHRMST